MRRAAVPPGLLVDFAGVIAGPEQGFTTGEPVAETVAAVIGVRAADQELLARLLQLTPDQFDVNFGLEGDFLGLLPTVGIFGTTEPCFTWNAGNFPDSDSFLGANALLAAVVIVVPERLG
jgi:hypothetical protein